MSLFLVAAAFSAALFDGLRPPVWAAVGCALMWLAAARFERRPSRQAAALWLPWLFWVALSTAASAEPLLSLSAAARWLTIGLFYALCRAVMEDEDAKLWSFALIVAALIAAAAALAGGAWLRYHGIHPGGEALTGILPPYYNYTVFLEAAGAAAAAALGRWPLAAGLTGAILLARGRGGLIAVALGAAVAIWRRGQARKAAPWAAGLSLALAAGCAVVVWRGGNLDYLLKPGTTLVRPEIWRAAAEAADDHPVLGTGPGLFGLAFLPHNFDSKRGIARYQVSTPYAHSEPMNAAAETGWAGLALLLLAVVGALYAGFRGPAGSPGRDAALCAAVAMSAHMVVDNMLQLPGLAFVWAGCLALAQPKGSSQPAGPGWRISTLSAAFACLLAFTPLLLLLRFDLKFAAADASAQRLNIAQAALKVAPADGGWLERAGLTALELGRVPEAQGYLRRASQADPKRPFAALALAETLPCEQALPLAEKALSAEPNFLSARLLRDEALLECGGAGGRAAARADLTFLPVLRAEMVIKAEHSLMLQGWGLTGYEHALLAFDHARYEKDLRRAEAPSRRARKR